MTIKVGDKLPEGTLQEFIEVEGNGCSVGPNTFKVEDMVKGKKIATPQLGNTQDVALRYWLEEQGIKTNKEGGGDASVVPQENAQTLETFKTGDIQAAWVPEPWATRLINEGGGKVLVDEKSLWPDGEFVTTHLIVRTKFLEEHPGEALRPQVDNAVQYCPAMALSVEEE